MYLTKWNNLRQTAQLPLQKLQNISKRLQDTTLQQEGQTKQVKYISIANHCASDLLATQCYINSF